MALLAGSAGSIAGTLMRGIEVLGKSVADHAPTVPRYLMQLELHLHGPGVRSWTPCRPNAITHPTKVARWKHTFTKFTIFGLVQFQRVLFLDADTLVPPSLLDVANAVLLARAMQCALIFFHTDTPAWLPAHTPTTSLLAFPCVLNSMRGPRRTWLDAQVVGSLEELWRWPIPDGISVAAVPDSRKVGKTPFWHPNTTWAPAPWFNTGVMLVRPNATFYRELVHATASHELPFLKEGVSHAGGEVKGEQDVLNGFVGSHWARLPLRFNANHALRAMRPAWDAAMPMHVLHFTLYKPWSGCKRYAELCNQWLKVLSSFAPQRSKTAPRAHAALSPHRRGRNSPNSD